LLNFDLFSVGLPLHQCHACRAQHAPTRPSRTFL
jgi:hypothetical protein